MFTLNWAPKIKYRGKAGPSIGLFEGTGNKGVEGLKYEGKN